MSMIYYFADNNWSKDSVEILSFGKQKKKWNNWKNIHVDEKILKIFK